MFKPDDHDNELGSLNTPKPEGSPVGKFLEKHIPGAHTFSAWHDTFVGYALDQGLPFHLVNFPSMVIMYPVALGAEFFNLSVHSVNTLTGASIPIPFLHTDPPD